MPDSHCLEIYHFKAIEGFTASLYSPSCPLSPKPPSEVIKKPINLAWTLKLFTVSGAAANTERIFKKHLAILSAHKS